jgi:amino acid transporter
VVLGGNVKGIEDPRANFRGDSFEGTTDNAFQLVSALVRINFAYEGWSNSFNMVNEIKNPVRTIRWAGALSLGIVGVLYILCNVAYFAAVPKEDILGSSTLTAALFFENVFGVQAARGLNFLILTSAFGNLVSNLIGASRIIREIGRQGVLPYPAFWSSVKPFGTPLGPYVLKWVFTIVMIIAPPAGDAFDFGKCSSHTVDYTFEPTTTPLTQPRLLALLSNMLIFYSC